GTACSSRSITERPFESLCVVKFSFGGRDSWLDGAAGLWAEAGKAHTAAAQSTAASCRHCFIPNLLFEPPPPRSPVRSGSSILVALLAVKRRSPTIARSIPAPNLDAVGMELSLRLSP